VVTNNTAAPVFVQEGARWPAWRAESADRVDPEIPSTRLSSKRRAAHLGPERCEGFLGAALRVR